MRAMAPTMRDQRAKRDTRAKLLIGVGYHNSHGLSRDGMSTRHRCCYGMPAAAVLMRQGKERWVGCRLLPGILSTVLARPVQCARTPFLACHNDPTLDPRARSTCRFVAAGQERRDDTASLGRSGQEPDGRGSTLAFAEIKGLESVHLLYFVYQYSFLL